MGTQQKHFIGGVCFQRALKVVKRWKVVATETQIKNDFVKRGGEVQCLDVIFVVRLLS